MGVRPIYVQIGEVEPGQACFVIVEGQASGKETVFVEPFRNLEVAAGRKGKIVNGDRPPLVSHVGNKAGITPENPGKRWIQVGGGIGELRKMYILGMEPGNHPESQ